VKDLTKKYAGHWLSCARKLRLSEEWWQQVLAPFHHSDTARDELENKRIHG
jgi:Rad4 transglutaminase-like domain